MLGLGSVNISMTLMMHEVFRRNNYYSKEFRMPRRYKMCMMYLGWMDVLGKKINRDELKRLGYTDKMIKTLVRERWIKEYTYQPIGRGRLFFYTVMNNVSDFILRTRIVEKTEDTIEIEVKQIQKQIV